MWCQMMLLYSNSVNSKYKWYQKPLRILKISFNPDDRGYSIWKKKCCF